MRADLAELDGNINASVTRMGLIMTPACMTTSYMKDDPDELMLVWPAAS